MRASTLLSAVLSAAALAVPSAARSSTGDRVLVVLDPAYDRADYSKFFTSLEKRGYHLSFTQPDVDGQIEGFGVPIYDHLVHFAPESKKFSNGLSPQEVLGAQARYLNTLYVLSPGLADVQRDTLREYDIEPGAPGQEVADAFAHVAGSDVATVVLGHDALVAPAPILSDATRTGAGPVVVPHAAPFAPGLNPFLVDILRAPRTAYATRPAGDLPKAGAAVPLAGARISLAAAMQNRENVRIGFVASPAMLSDEWWGAKLDGVETGNRAVIEDLTKWLFQETGVVRVVRTAHHRVGGSQPLDEYRKQDEVTYEITLQQHDGAGNSSAWKPFAADDLQFEFTMLDPFIRKALPAVASASDSTTYATTFVAPDRHGVFKFVVDYWRPGWTYIRAADRTSVVPLRHDEHPRFIVGAYPFYTGALSSSACFLFFAVLWAFVREGDKPKKKSE